MIEATILRSEVLRQLDTGEPFNLEFVTADRKRGTGGELIKVQNWVKRCNTDDCVPLTVGRQQPTTNRKRPTKTLVIFNPHNRIQHAISVHVRLLQIFNGKRIING
ncbi:MAG: hypothetical protein EOO14_04995 [Chitinophagaceae bacterium]|nr:MAG: hypothetical protein EOO14_04995 [Chitinophagaceae bacterium]